MVSVGWWLFIVGSSHVVVCRLLIDSEVRRLPIDSGIIIKLCILLVRFQIEPRNVEDVIV